MATPVRHSGSDAHRCRPSNRAKSHINRTGAKKTIKDPCIVRIFSPLQNMVSSSLLGFWIVLTRLKVRLAVQNRARPHSRRRHAWAPPRSVGECVSWQVGGEPRDRLGSLEPLARCHSSGGEPSLAFRLLMAFSTSNRCVVANCAVNWAATVA